MFVVLLCGLPLCQHGNICVCIFVCVYVCPFAQLIEKCQCCKQAEKRANICHVAHGLCTAGRCIGFVCQCVRSGPANLRWKSLISGTCIIISPLSSASQHAHRFSSLYVSSPLQSFLSVMSHRLC